MLKNYLLVAWRGLCRHRLYTLINAAGLVIGLVSCLLIALFVGDELSFDRHHENAGRIYRLVGEYINEANGEQHQNAATAWRLAPALLQGLPGVEKVVRLYRAGPLIGRGQRRFFERSFFFADAGFFDVFTAPLVRGDPATALKEPRSIVLTEAMARKYFGDEDPMGQVLSLGQSIPAHTVTGVLRDAPENSHLQFDFLASMAIAPELFSATTLDTWRAGQYTYALLAKGYTADQFAADLADFSAQCRRDGAPFIRLLGQPLSRIHLHSNIKEELAPNGSVELVYMALGAAFFILLIACLNYTNMSVARAQVRAREIGLRKVVGASRGLIAGQFLGESVLLALGVLGLALGALYFVLPWFNATLDKELGLVQLGGWGCVALVLFSALVGLAAGAYPAFLLSAFEPVRALQGRLQKGGRGAGLRNGLVVVQLTVSLVMVICAGVASQQLQLLQSKPLGFAKENILVIERARFVGDRLQTFKDEISGHAAVKGIAATKHIPPDPLVRAFEVLAQGRPPRDMKVVLADADLLATLEIGLAQGANFPRQEPASGPEAVVINRAAARELGWEQPLGKRFDIPYLRKEGYIAGVVEDYHFESLHQDIAAVAFVRAPSWYSKFAVRISAENTAATVAFIRDKWRQFVPDKPFEFYFLDDRFDQLYRREERLGGLLSAASLLSILIACMGLFGLVSYLAERRTGEIGVRKVLGASTPSIVLLLGRQFLGPFALGALIAWPLAYWIMSRWLADFAHRVELGPGIFLVSTAIALAAGWLTVGPRALIASLANPVEALRHD
ncbi:MAG: FtsX-like permease family protein [Candidatus Latescibacteria bacterium]|nr:FtsX-like permease family protein [Candidatus Latescibacterota bacterium]